MGPPKVAVVFHHIGPYHHARLNAAAQRLSILGLEWFAVGSYPWGVAVEQCGYEKKSLFARYNSKQSYHSKVLENHFINALRDYSPDVLVVNGWKDFGSLISLSVGRCMGIPLVVM